MKKLLFINACVRGESSRTLRLANAFLDTVNRNEYEIIRRDITEGETMFLTKASFLSNGETKRDIDPSPALEFANADKIVIAAPYWEFLFPAVLSAYMERVSIPGITFMYTENGSKGLCKADSLTYIYTAGDNLKYEDKLCDRYFEKLSKLYGIESFSSISAEGLDIDPSKAQEIVDNICAKIKEKRI